jgi:hypothetical protein
LIHEHSIEAYHAEQPRLSRRALAILDWLELHGASTDREIVYGMGFSDMNCVRPRITEAIEAWRAGRGGREALLADAGRWSASLTYRWTRRAAGRTSGSRLCREADRHPR